MEKLKDKISSTLREGVYEYIIPSTQKTINPVNISTKSSSPNLIKLYPDERILEVQRQHIVALLQSFTPAFIIFVLGIISSFLVYQQTIFTVGDTIAFCLLLTTLSLSATLLLYSYMSWYFQFYIITNKCLIHKHFFRMSGYNIEEVFLTSTTEREIKRNASNMIFSLLGIEDITVSFQKLGLEEFYFRLPENPQRVEDALEKISLGKENHK